MVVTGACNDEEEEIYCRAETGRWLNEDEARAAEREPCQSTRSPSHNPGGTWLVQAGPFKEDAVGSQEVDLGAWISFSDGEKQPMKMEEAAPEKEEELLQEIS
ncbi:hypothetical protein NDU88_001866 [Pleurodeles waltl]|uniref:Uncharacterized protein n=1 Tax=Pleurodeles waltl TaxID=8319 RepID=A0AAV7U8V3_PLEWA|nr:hypothetical protein NDU88_001866 [Pleurodeles waltl]